MGNITQKVAALCVSRTSVAFCGALPCDVRLHVHRFEAAGYRISHVDSNVNLKMPVDSINDAGEFEANYARDAFAKCVLSTSFECPAMTISILVITAFADVFHSSIHPFQLAVSTFHLAPPVHLI